MAAAAILCARARAVAQNNQIYNYFDAANFNDSNDKCVQQREPLLVASVREFFLLPRHSQRIK